MQNYYKLFEHLIHKRSLAVVNVSNDGDVADIVAFHELVSHNRANLPVELAGRH